MVWSVCCQLDVILSVWSQAPPVSPSVLVGPPLDGSVVRGEGGQAGSSRGKKWEISWSCHKAAVSSQCGREIRPAPAPPPPPLHWSPPPPAPPPAQSDPRPASQLVTVEVIMWREAAEADCCLLPAAGYNNHLKLFTWSSLAQLISCPTVTVKNSNSSYSFFIKHVNSFSFPCLNFPCFSFTISFWSSKMPAVRGDGMRGLAVFISDIRNCKSKEAEIKRINKELANIRSKFKVTSSFPYWWNRYNMRG